MTKVSLTENTLVILLKNLPHKDRHDSGETSLLEFSDVSHVDAVILKLIDLIERQLFVIYGRHLFLFLELLLLSSCSGRFVTFGLLHSGV